MLSIINLVFISPELGPLFVWEIPEKYSSILDHELILLGWEETKQESLIFGQENPIRWSIQKLVEDKNLLKEAKMV